MGGHTVLGSGQGGHEANGGDDERMHGDSVSLGCVVKADVRARAGVYCRRENENEGVWWVDEESGRGSEGSGGFVMRKKTRPCCVFWAPVREVATLTGCLHDDEATCADKRTTWTRLQTDM